MDQHADPLTLVLMAGLPGAGKSTLAQAIGQSFGWPVIDKDTLKSTLLETGVEEGIAAPAAYELMWSLARDILVDQQLPLILDSPLPNERSLDNARELAEAAGARCKIILCLADRNVRNQRVSTRAGKISQPSRVSTTIGARRDRYQHLPDDALAVHTDTDRSLASVMGEVGVYLQSAVSS